MSVLTTRLSRDFKLGVKNLLLHKLRSFLTMLGLVFGVGSVIAMLAIGEGASQEALAQIRKLGSRNILLTAAKPADDDSSGRGHNLSVYGLLYNDVRRLESSFPTVLSAIHDLNMAALYCDRLYVMKQGRILMEGTPEEVYKYAYQECMDGARDGRFILSGDCDVSPMTPDENVIEAVRAAKDAEKVLFGKK